MNDIVYIILCGVLVFFGFKINTVLGLLAFIAVIGMLSYRLYPEFTIGRANAEFNNGETEDALKSYKKIVRSGRADLDTRISYANILMRAGRSDEALSEINKILSSKLEEKKKYIAKQTRSIINYTLGNMDDAMEELNELFEDGYKTSYTYSMMGLFMLIMNYPSDKTIALCEEAYEYDSDSRDILDNLETAYYNAGEYEKAKEISDKLTELAPEFVEGFYHGALIHEALGDSETAKEYAKKLKSCKRTLMTTISKEDEEALCKRLA